MSADLLAALCLVLVIEGLFLFAAPESWKRAVEQLSTLAPTRLRSIGGFMVIGGLMALYLVRGH
jgi:hypothetical protein